MDAPRPIIVKGPWGSHRRNVRRVRDATGLRRSTSPLVPHWIVPPGKPQPAGGEGGWLRPEEAAGAPPVRAAISVIWRSDVALTRKSVSAAGRRPLHRFLDQVDRGPLSSALRSSVPRRHPAPRRPGCFRRPGPSPLRSATSDRCALPGIASAGQLFRRRRRPRSRIRSNVRFSSASS